MTTTISELQKRAWKNKVEHGFNLDNTEREFCLLTGEVGEAYLAWLRGEDELDLELADILIYLLGIAEMNGVDLGEATLRKMEINEKRKYKKNKAGVLVKE